MNVAEGVPERYRIEVRGRLSERLGSAFEALDIERRPGATVLRGNGDDVRLTEVLERLRDFGLEVVSVDVE